MTVANAPTVYRIMARETIGALELTFAQQKTKKIRERERERGNGGSERKSVGACV